MFSFRRIFPIGTIPWVSTNSSNKNDTRSSISPPFSPIQYYNQFTTAGMPEVEEGDYLNCMLNGETVELEVAYEASLGEFTMYATPASSSVRSSYQI